MNESLLAIVLKLTLALTSDAGASLLFAGDAMMHQAQIDAARTSDGIYRYEECFDPVRNLVGSADYAVVNLETPLGKNRFSGYPCFNSPVSYAEALAGCGFDLFLTANNHTLDRHDAGLLHTITALDSMKLQHIGTYASDSIRRRQLPHIVEINGFRIGFLNYTYGTNGIEIQGDVVVDYIDRQQIADDVNATRKAGAEMIVCCMHWGDEYKLQPVASQKKLADYLKELGVEIIIGGHPHVVQPMEFFEVDKGKRGVVVYSLGNFISNMKTRDTRGGALATVNLKRDSLGKVVVDTAYYNLVFTVPPTAEADRNFKVYPIDSVPQQWRGAANAFRSALKSSVK